MLCFYCDFFIPSFPMEKEDLTPLDFQWKILLLISCCLSNGGISFFLYIIYIYRDK